MSRTARLWKGAGPAALGGLLLSGVLVRGAEPPPLSQQLSELGRQALARGETAQAQTFFRKALELDPTNAAARQGLSRAVPPQVRRVALQDRPRPGRSPAPAAAPTIRPPRADGRHPGCRPPAPATGAIEPRTQRNDRAEQTERGGISPAIRRTTSGSGSKRPRAKVNGSQPEEALYILKIALNFVAHVGRR